MHDGCRRRKGLASTTNEKETVADTDSDKPLQKWREGGREGGREEGTLSSRSPATMDPPPGKKMLRMRQSIPRLFDLTDGTVPVLHPPLQ